LTWDVATDNDMVSGYNIYYGTNSVTEDGGEYNLGMLDVGNVIEYEMKNLENGKKYYFAITAYDPSANESENYSYEVSATPVAGVADTTAPTVVKAEAIDKYTVLVTFSETITLPGMGSQTAFTIVEDGAGTSLDVLSAAINVKDVNKKSVLLTTAKQKAGSNYILTAGIAIKDKAGNSIQSGTSDTALFTGTDKEVATFGAAEEKEKDTTAPTVASVKATDSKTVVVIFSEPVVLGIDPASNFIITEENNYNALLSIIDAEIELDDMTVTLVTDVQSDTNYNFIVQDTIVDMAGNAIDPQKNSTVFKGKASVNPSAGDLIADSGSTTNNLDGAAPEDVTDFIAKVIEGMIVALSWTSSLNTAGDIAGYVLYKSTDGVSFGDGIVLTPDMSSYNISDLKPGIKHFFKLAAQDNAGNESKGVITSLMLPETGPEIALLLAASIGIGRVLRKKRK
jgi:hypothetical protein